MILGQGFDEKATLMPLLFCMASNSVPYSLPNPELQPWFPVPQTVISWCRRCAFPTCCRYAARHVWADETKAAPRLSIGLSTT